MKLGLQLCNSVAVKTNDGCNAKYASYKNLITLIELNASGIPFVCQFAQG